MSRLLPMALVALLLAGVFSACSSITVLRTSEIKAVGNNVRTDVNRQVDSLRAVIDSLRTVQELYNNRLKADMAVLTSRISDEGERDNARMEEIIYRLDLLMNKSEKILSKKVVVGRDADTKDSSAQALAQQQEMEALYNTARADYHRGEYKLAYGAFKQVFESVKTGELAENALYWMALCMQDGGQTANAQVLMQRVVDQFPDGGKQCVALYKLSVMADAEGKRENRKVYLQRLLAQKKCADTNEFLKAAEELESLLAEGDSTSVQVNTGAVPSGSASTSSSSAERASSSSVATP